VTEHGELKLHRAEVELILLLRRLRFGTIERLEVQDGRPVMAQVVKEKIRFGKGA